MEKQSGLSVADWKKHDMKVSQMYYWIRKYESSETKPKHQPSTQWIAVQMADEAASNIIIHVGDLSVKVQPGFILSY